MPVTRAGAYKTWYLIGTELREVDLTSARDGDAMARGQGLDATWMIKASAHHPDDYSYSWSIWRIVDLNRHVGWANKVFPPDKVIRAPTIDPAFMYVLAMGAQ